MNLMTPLDSWLEHSAEHSARGLAVHAQMLVPVLVPVLVQEPDAQIEAEGCKSQFAFTSTHLLTKACAAGSSCSTPASYQMSQVATAAMLTPLMPS